MSVTRHRLIHALLGAVLACGAAGAGEGIPPGFDDYAARVLREFHVPGIAVAIVKDGKVLLAKGYGVRRLGSPTPVDEHSLFGIGSNTKAFTTAALAMLVDEGKISWDDPVYERLPGFAMYDPYVSHEMTIRDLVTHRSGMGLGEGDLLIFPQSNLSRGEIIHRLRFMKPASSFRSRFAYDNLLYIAAGQILPAVTKVSWDDTIRRRIFAPLGMTDSNVSVRDMAPGADLATPHSMLDGHLTPIEPMNLDNTAPAGSINSSAADMARWVLLRLNRGRMADGTRLFSEKQAAEMWSAQTILPIGAPPEDMPRLKHYFSAYGLGWFLADYQGHYTVSHTGGVAGYVSLVCLAPEKNLGFVVLTNAEEGAAFEAIRYKLLDYYFDLPETDWLTTWKTFSAREQARGEEAVKNAAPARDTHSRPSLPLAKYAGLYRDDWYGRMTISLENGSLVIRSHHAPQMVGDLQHWQFDTFQAHWRDRGIEDAFVTFSLTPGGAIAEFTMKAVSPLADFSFDYQDLLFRPVPAPAAH